MKLGWIVLILTPLPVFSSSCYDFEKNGNETDIDCGGNECWRRCSVGEACTSLSDCEYTQCIHHVCTDITPEFRALKDLASGNNNDTAIVVVPYDELNRAISIVAFLMSFVAFILGCKLSEIVCKRRRRNPYVMDNEGNITRVNEQTGEVETIER